jgi:hypothetical protein
VQNCERCSGKRWLAKIDPETGLQLKHHIKLEEVEYDLRIWKCWRCGHVQHEVEPFIPLYKRSKANILYIDLEVSKSLYFNYGAKVPSKYLRSDDLLKEYFIICWSASYVGNRKVWSECVTPDEALAWNDARILPRLQELISSADLIAGHNVMAFDIKRANTRFFLNGLEPVIDKKAHDTLKIARSKFSFESNKLDDIRKRLGLRPKDDIRNEDWLNILKTGDEKTLAKINKYCKADVVEGKKVLEFLMKYSGKKEWYGSVTLDAPPQWLKGKA